MKHARILAFVLSASTLFGCSAGVDATPTDSTPSPAPCSAIDPGHGTVPASVGTNQKGGTRWFAFDRLDFGTTVRGTTQTSACAWMDYGFDLDGLKTTREDSISNTNTCTRAAGTPQAVLADGTDGIDNAFGGHVVQALRSLDSCAGARTVDGSYTLLLRLDDLGDGDDAHVPGALYVARDLGHAPAFDGSDRWQIDPRSLEDGKSIDKPRVRFDKGYVVNGVWVGGAASATVDVPFMFGFAGTLSFGGATSTSGCPEANPVELDVPVAPRQLTVRIADGREGVVGGVVNPYALVDGFTPGLEAMGVCPDGASFAEIFKVSAMAEDLVQESSTLNDPKQPCDAISFGMGFSMREAGEPAGVGEIPAPPKPNCQ